MNREKKTRWTCPPHSLNPSIDGIFIFQFENRIEYHEFHAGNYFSQMQVLHFFTAKRSKILLKCHVLAPHNHRIEQNGTPLHLTIIIIYRRCKNHDILWKMLTFSIITWSVLLKHADLSQKPLTIYIYIHQGSSFRFLVLRHYIGLLRITTFCCRISTVALKMDWQLYYIKNRMT